MDRVEILQSGDSRFDVYGGGCATVTVYDIAVAGHPSFAVNGFIVHNCKEEAWHAVRSTLTATRGPIRIIGNVKGRRNWAYQLARRAESGESGMRYEKITAADAIQAGILAADEVEDARGKLPEHVFRELYEAVPSDDGGNPFGLAAIRACLAPLSESEPVGWGWDLAKSADWTVGVALDASGTACAFERWQGPWETTIRRIALLTGHAPALVDSTGVGDPVLEALQKGHSNYEGFKFTALSKQQLMEGLAVAIQQRTVRFPDGQIAAELETFEYEYTRTGVRYAAPEGLHDDCVMALALAVRRAQAFRPAGVVLWDDDDASDSESVAPVSGLRRVIERTDPETLGALQIDFGSAMLDEE